MDWVAIFKIFLQLQVHEREIVVSIDSWYEYYRLEDVPYFALDEDGDPCSSWLRSPYYSYTNRFCRVYSNGTIGNHLASWSAGVRPGFSF